MRANPLHNISRGSKLATDLREALTDPDKSKLQRAVTAGLATSASWKNVLDAYGTAKARLCYTVTVTDGSDDHLFTLVMKWVSENMPEHRRRATLAKYRNGEVVSSYDGNREQFLTVEGHRVSVMVNTRGLAESGAGGSTLDSWDLYTRFKTPERIVFTTLTAEGRRAVVRLLNRLSNEWFESRQGLPDLCLWTRHGWSNTGGLLPRSLDSVVLAPGQVDRIISTLETFETMEDRYLELGLPWHTGLLFYGPPGTGKSSIARAIASHFGRTLYYLSLASVESDETLFGAVAAIPAGAILLLEDVDTMGGVQNRDTALPAGLTPQRGVTMSGVLNVLDGVMTPHGLIKILSTNHLDRLDPAVYRRGRVDLVEEIGYATPEMAVEIFAHAFPEHPISISSITPETSPAKVVGALKPHLTDPAAAAVALQRLCSGDDGGVEEALHSMQPSDVRRARRSSGARLSGERLMADPGVSDSWPTRG